MGLGMIGESSPLIIKSKRVRVRGLTGAPSLTLPRCGNVDAKGTSNDGTPTIHRREALASSIKLVCGRRMGDRGADSAEREGREPP